MQYRLWDTDAGQMFGAFETEEEALSVVRILVSKYGDEIIEDLGLARVRPDGSPDVPLNGHALVERANAVATSPEPEPAGEGQTKSSRVRNGYGGVSSDLPMAAAGRYGARNIVRRGAPASKRRSSRGTALIRARKHAKVAP